MRRGHVVVHSSLVVSVLILAWALFSTSGMQHELQRNAATTVVAFLVCAVICAWPWFVALSVAGEPNRAPGVVLFALASVAIVAGFARPIASAPAEGVGWNVIICVLFVWLASLLLKVRWAASG
jgi:hypothetical protein